MLRYLTGIAGLVLLGLASVAQAQFYAQRTTDIRAAIVIIDSAQNINSQPLNFTPFVWYNLDSNQSVRPADWNLYNPSATTQATQAVVNRWTALGGPVPALNSSLSKSTAAYWEIRLSQVSDQQLSNYDVLLLSAYGYTNLNTVERDKLRKFVDQGGTLWVDIDTTPNSGGVQVNTFPLPVQSSILGNVPLSNSDSFSPLTSNPYVLTLANLDQMRVDRSSFASPLTVSAPMTWDIESWLSTDFLMHFDSVASSGNGPTVLLGRLGDGFIVVSSSQYAMALNQVATSPSVYSPNNQFFALPPTFDRVSQLAAKFAVNVLSLSSRYSQPGAGARHPNSILNDLRAPLLKVSGVPDPAILPGQSPVLYKGLLVVASGNRLKVYNAKPGTDLDGDLIPDDGLPDFSLGLDYDELWESGPMGNQISAPTCAEIPGSAHKDQIFVVDDKGNLYAYDAFHLVGGTIQGAVGVAPIYGPIGPPAGISNPQFDTSKLGPGPYAPTFHDGLLYVPAVQSSPQLTGAVYVVDPISQAPVMTSGTNPWFVGANGSATLPEPSGSPTIGYIPVQDNSGGYDRVMYLPGRPSGVSGPIGTASITSLWLGVRGESPPPNSVTMAALTLTVTTRAARQGLKIYTEAGLSLNALANRALGIKLTMLHPNGDPFTNAEMQTYFDGTVVEGGGVLNFNLKTALPTDANGNLIDNVRLDYSIDWGTNSGSATTNIIRGQLNLPDDFQDYSSGSEPRRILGNIAMSPRGTIYCVTSTGSSDPLPPAVNVKDCGSFYAIREDIGRGGFRLLTRYQLYPRHNIPLNQAGSASDEPKEVNYEQTLEDSDGLLSLPSPGIAYLQGKDFAHLTFVGTPSVRGGVVYATVLGRKANGGFSAFIPFSILMAFKAEPEPPEIKVGNVLDGFSLRQYDIDRSSIHGNPTATDDMSQSQFSYDRSEGVIRFDNLMTTNRGVMLNAFSTSLPVILRRPNMPDQFIEPDVNSNKWSPLLWYAVMHGVQPTGGAFTSGGSVFIPGASVLPNLAQLALGKVVVSGMLEAVNANPAPNDPFLQPYWDGSRPWMHQLWQIGPYITPPPNSQAVGPSGANPDFLWPQIAGVQSFEDYLVRVRQTKLGVLSTTAYGVLGGEGSLAAWGDGGVYTFSKADFLVADEGRLIRLDASGNPLWSSSTSSSTGTVDAGVVGALKPLVRPVRAYPVSTGDIVVVDPGANRIARLDLSGRELRSITGFHVDPANVPDGFKANEPMTLNGPRDVTFFITYGGGQLWHHYLIADTGNKRIVEVVDKYSIDANNQITGTLDVGVLNWHSPSNYSGKTFDYVSLTRVYDPNSGRYFYAAGIGGALPSRVDTGLDTPVGGSAQARESAAGNGGIVVFDPLNPAGNAIINQILVPDVPANAFWNFQTGSFNSPFRGAHYKTLTNVNSVTAKTVVDNFNMTRVALMIADGTGVYEVWLQDPKNDPTTDWIVRWMLPNEAYRGIRQILPNPPSGQNAMDLRANYARRLDDGDIIVVNGYYGNTRGGAGFLGEVIQINGDFDPILGNEGFDFNKPNLGFDLGMIVFQLPPIQGARGLVIPVFADRR
ncbi:MAG: hypothetical protein ACHQ50_01980 [Fimbriimonadales bacterium]